MTRSFVFTTRATALSIGLTLLVSTLATAQTATTPGAGATAPGATVADIPLFARQLAGKNVWITADGARREGRVTSLTPAGLVMVEHGAPTTIPYTQIVRVEKSTHHLRNGALIGFAAGAGLGVVAGIWLCEGDCAGWEYPVLAAYYGGLGAAAGVGIGAIVRAATKHGDVIYDARRTTTTVSLAPILSPTRKGVAFSMTWR